MKLSAPACSCLALAALLGCAGPAPAPQPAPQPQPKPPARASAESPPLTLEGGELRFDLPATERAAARARALELAFAHVLERWSFAALKGERRAELVQRAGGLLRQEELSGGRYRAVADVDEVRNRILDELQVEQTFGRDPFVTALLNDDWYTGEGLTLDEQEALGGTARAALADHLNRLRFRETENEQAQIDQAALELGATPSAQLMQEFCQAFQASLVVRVGGKIRFEPEPDELARAEWAGRLRCENVEAVLWDRDTSTVLARVTLRSEPGGEGPGVVDQPRLRQGAALGDACEAYAGAIGRELGVEVARRMFERFYAGDRRGTR